MRANAAASLPLGLAMAVLLAGCIVPPFELGHEPQGGTQVTGADQLVTIGVGGEGAAEPPVDPRVALEPARASWPLGSPGGVRASFANGAEWFNYTAPSSCTWPEVWVELRGARLLLDEGGVRSDAACAQAPQQVALPPGTLVAWEVRWDGSDGRGGQVAPGAYVLRAAFPGVTPWDTAGEATVELTG